MKVLLLLSVVATAVAMDIIDGEYLVQFRVGKTDEALTTMLDNRNVEAVKFFRMKSTTIVHVKAGENDINSLRKLPEVTNVEPNQWFYAMQACTVEACPDTWGLDRSDQRESLTTTPAEAMYEWGESTGAGAHAYVVDTGIRITHDEFAGRAVWGHSAGSNPEMDDNGHGTHCAGTIGSRNYGLAKDVNLVAVKVLGAGGSGSTADVVEGIDWVRDNFLTYSQRASINLSLGGGASPALDTACDEAIDAGVSVVCAAGNSNADACNSSPGRTPRAISVGATQSDDQTATFTNWGECVDVFAPGVAIKSTWHLSDSATNTISGTSMACPHVVGAVARFQSSQGSPPAPIDVTNYIVAQSTPNEIVFRPGHGTSPDRMLYSPCVLA